MLKVKLFERLRKELQMDPKTTHALDGLREDLEDVKESVEVGPVALAAVERLERWMGSTEAWALVLGVLSDWQKKSKKFQ